MEITDKGHQNTETRSFTNTERPDVYQGNTLILYRKTKI